MSFIQNLFTSRDNNANSSTYVGQQDRIWWNPDTNAFYYSNGNTAGGVPVGVSSAANISINNFTANSGTINNNLIVTGNISAAATNKIGGIQPGPGVNISNVGLLTIDSANLSFSFGNFYASNNILSIVNSDENMILATQGNAIVQLVGNVGFYKTGNSAPSGKYLSATTDGIITVYVTQTGSQGAFNIIGTTTGSEISPGQTGAMLHVTGQLADPCRLYYDGNDNYVSMVARRWNGNVAVPTQVLAGEDVLRINSTAATNAGVGNVGMAQMRMTALENQTTTAQGSSITFTVTPVGSSASARVDVANVTTANGVWATKFNTSGTMSATGSITSAANITGGNVLTGGLISATGNITGNYIIGNGSALTSITGANVTGTVANATYATSAGTATSATTAATVTTNAQPNITSVGTLTSLSSSGNITASYFLGNGSQLTGIVSSYGNANVNTLLAAWGSNTVSTTGTITAGNITGGNVLTGGQVSATGNITGGNLNISTGGTIHTPKVIINDGGIRTVAGGTALTLDFSTDSIVLWTSPSGTATITLSNYTPGATAKVIIRVGTTSRDINYGVVDGNNSTTGSNNFNGSGGGSTSIANQAFVLDYTCYDATAANCYVQVSWQ